MKNYILENNIIKLQPLAYPDVNHLNKSNRILLDKTQLLLQTKKYEYGTLVKNAIQVINTGNINLLKHRLSAHIDSKMFYSENSSSHQEFAFYKNARINFMDKLDSDDSFISFIGEVGNKIKGGTNAIRQGSIRTVPDETGGYTEFIDISILKISLSSLREYALIKNNENYLFMSIIFSVMFMHTHPLLDGNGRTSRFLFNLMLKDKLSDYIPLTELCFTARSGYILSLREAFLFSEWDNIIKFYCNCIHLLYGELKSGLSSMQ